jgi:Delta3-Delta2-enoyl-CoA isomerase
MSERVRTEQQGDVTVVRLVHEDNRFHPDMIAGVNAALDAAEGPVVLTGQGKFFSNGLDLEFLGGAGEAGVNANLDEVDRLLGRVLGHPAPVVAAVNGHAFGAGIMLALAADFRVARADRGFWCFPEVDIGVGFRPLMMGLIRAKVPAPLLQELVVTGARVTGEDAAARGLAHVAVPEDRVLAEATERAQALAGKPQAALGQIKAGLYAEALALVP